VKTKNENENNGCQDGKCNACQSLFEQQREGVAVFALL